MILTSYLDKLHFVVIWGRYVEKHSNDVGQQVETPGKATIFVVQQIYLVAWYNFHVALEVV